MNSLGQITEVGSRSLLQWIFLIQESNRGVLHCRWILYQLSYQGSPLKYQIPYLNLPSVSFWISFSKWTPPKWKLFLYLLLHLDLLSVYPNSACMLSHFSHVQLDNPMDCSLPDTSRILEWVTMLSSRESSSPRIEPGPPASPALQADSLLLSHQGSPIYNFYQLLKM